jgi:DNA-binding GntR family transcriptional regulator
MSVLTTVSVVEALAQRLREQVLDGVIPPNATVAETDVAATFGVSRPTAKGAILMLVGSGLIRREANRPAYVPELTAEDIFDIYRVRVPLEVEVVRILADQRAAVPAADAAVAELERLPDETATSQLIATDLQFHRALVAAVKSPRLTRHYESIIDEVHLAMKQYWRMLGHEKIAREHAEVLRFIHDGNAARAAQAARDHLEGAARMFAGALDRSE